jgi:hypothetical protein
MLTKMACVAQGLNEEKANYTNNIAAQYDAI